jgi:hypothetical protein
MHIPFNVLNFDSLTVYTLLRFENLIPGATKNFLNGSKRII